jgi:hypothetical protein
MARQRTLCDDCMKSCVCGDQSAFLGHGKRQVQTVVDAVIESDGQFESGSTARLLPEDVAELGTDQVRSAENELGVEETCGRGGMDLRYEPIWS